MDIPTVARNVHYVAYGTPGGEFPAGVCRAALITEVDSLTALGEGVTIKIDSDGSIRSVGLCVLNPTGFYFLRHVPYDATGQKPGTWHWPERV